MSQEAVQTLSHKDLSLNDVQACPLCGQMHPIHFRGIEIDHKAGEYRAFKEKGFSFCNCSNIYFTDWKNMEQAIYDEDYYKRYQGFNNEAWVRCVENYSIVYFPMFKEFNFNIKSFLEIGSIHDIILNQAAKAGWTATGVDIFKHPSEHPLLVGNFEELATVEKFDVIWASHIFEHFKDPLSMVRKCHSMLNNNGLLFIAMPDPWFINHKVIHSHPETWAHFHVKEHHIMWDMDSFIDQVIDRGFECVFARRNAGIEFTTYGDFHLIFKKV